MGEDTGMSAKEYGDFVCDPLFSLLQTNNYERLFLHMMEATTALMSLQNPGMPEADKEQKLRQVRCCCTQASLLYAVCCVHSANSAV